VRGKLKENNPGKSIDNPPRDRLEGSQGRKTWEERDGSSDETLRIFFKSSNPPLQKFHIWVWPHLLSLPACPQTLLLNLLDDLPHDLEIVEVTQCASDVERNGTLRGTPSWGQFPNFLISGCAYFGVRKPIFGFMF
jgi:hypothetical protein